LREPLGGVLYANWVRDRNRRPKRLEPVVCNNLGGSRVVLGSRLLHGCSLGFSPLNAWDCEIDAAIVLLTPLANPLNVASVHNRYQSPELSKAESRRRRFGCVLLADSCFCRFCSRWSWCASCWVPHAPNTDRASGQRGMSG
jgi:hypothetical protein